MSETQEPIAFEGEHISPKLERPSFHCMHCGVLAQQHWLNIFNGGPGLGFNRIAFSYCECSNCSGVSVWRHDGRCVDPTIVGGPRPQVDMPDDVKADYEEARGIVSQSPRGACALLRLAVQKLCADLGGSGKDINGDIKKLVAEGLPVEVQQALDALRVIGNEAVHPGEMDLRDDVDTATALFGLLNFVVQDRIAAPRERKRLFGLLPERKREAIAKRDAAS
jgi:hypothetical protein